MTNKKPLLKRWDFWFMMSAIFLLFLQIFFQYGYYTKFINEQTYIDYLNDYYNNNTFTNDSAIGFNVDGVGIYLANTEFLNSYFDTPEYNTSCGLTGYTDTYGVYNSLYDSSATNRIFFNVDKFDEMYIDDETKFKVLNNVFLHEYSHFLDGRGYLQFFDSVINLSLDDYGRVENKQYYLDLFDEHSFEIDSDLAWTINFSRYWNVTDNCFVYDETDWQNEIRVRILAYCLELEHDSYNKLQFKEDDGYCSEFDFHLRDDDFGEDVYLKQYNIFIEDFVKSYVDAFILNESYALSIDTEGTISYITN